MEKVNVLIIGAGVIGLAVGKALSEEFQDVVIVEQEKSFGRHTSSRNSEVIHSGIHYPQNSLKARLCLEGNEMLYDFAQNHNIPYKKTGKIVVATSEEEIRDLYDLKENGGKNNIPGLSIIDESECNKLEPEILAVKGLFVPISGIIDTHKLMQRIESEAEKNDAFVVYDMKVISIRKTEKTYIVKFINGEIFEANILINCAGLYCENIAKMVGIETIENNLKIHWCKGEYFKTTKIKNIEHLIYPLPSYVSCGIHLAINLNGEVRFGPNANYVDELNYKMTDKYKKDFFKAVNKYIKIEEENLNMDDCGIRAKLQGPNDNFRDFYIKEESEKGFPNFINLMGIDSPGLTSCLSIAEEVRRIVKS